MFKSISGPRPETRSQANTANVDPKALNLHHFEIVPEPIKQSTLTTPVKHSQNIYCTLPTHKTLKLVIFTYVNVWRLFAAFEVGNANQLICEPRKKKKQVSIENFNCL
jgi:hypothetical protein